MGTKDEDPGPDYHKQFHAAVSVIQNLPKNGEAAVHPRLGDRGAGGLDSEKVALTPAILADEAQLGLAYLSRILLGPSCPGWDPSSRWESRGCSLSAIPWD